MPRTVVSALAAVAMLAFAAFAATPAPAEIMDETLLETALQGMEGMKGSVVRVEVGPGDQTERHIHPGHVFVYVIDGAVEIALEGREPQTLAAGEALYEPPNTPMVGRNVSSEAGATLVVVHVGPADAPLTVAQPE